MTVFRISTHVHHDEVFNLPRVAAAGSITVLRSQTYTFCESSRSGPRYWRKQTAGHGPVRVLYIHGTAPVVVVCWPRRISIRVLPIAIFASFLLRLLVSRRGLAASPRADRFVGKSQLSLRLWITWVELDFRLDTTTVLITFPRDTSVVQAEA